MSKAVIFDVDGTLVDSVDLHTRAWLDAFADFDQVIAYEHMRREIGKGGDQLLPVFLDEADLEWKGKTLEKHRGALFKARYMERVVSFADVRPLFQRLLADGQRIALASSAKGDELDHYKQVAGIADLLDAETSSEDADKSKPHPDIFQAALARLGGLDPSDAVVVGDTPHDAEAARKAGLRPVGLTCGGWSAEALTKAGCVAVYRSPSHLLAVLDETPLRFG